MHRIWILFLVPFFCSALLFLLQNVKGRTLKTVAFLLSLFPLAWLAYQFNSWIGSHVLFPWLPELGVNFYLKIDELSLVFLYLTAVIIPISILSVRSRDLSHPHMFYGLVLLLQALLIGFFSARDLVVFTLFWEAMLLPLYFMINLWGGEDRQRASLKFLIYMLAGSVLMIVALLALYFTSGNTFNMDLLHGSGWVAIVFMLAFAVKTPLFPFHAWLPDAYCQASTAGTILLSAILSKAGIYGFLRVGDEIFPEMMQQAAPLLLGLAIAGVLYAGLAAWMQTDFKRLIAYSSLSHVNFVLAGVFIWNNIARDGAILQALNHGITITALFLVAGWLEERLGGTTFGQFHGLAQFLPLLCWTTLFFVLSSVGLPGMNNFVGELLILLGVFTANFWAAVILALTVILSVIYMLRFMQKVYFEPPGFFQENWEDIKARELLIALPLALLVLWIGIYPAPLLKTIESKTRVEVNP